MRNIFWGALFLLCMCLVGCGRGEKAGGSPVQEEMREYYDIVTKRRNFPSSEELKAVLDADGGNHALRFLGMQFAKGEAVQIWAVRSLDSPLKAYLCRIEGEPELILDEITDEFDDGIHAVAQGFPAAINRASSHKDAAWEFLLYLLGEEAQSDVSDFPVRRDIYEEWVEKQLDRISGWMFVMQGFGGVTDGEEVFVGREYRKKDLDFIREEKLPYFAELLEEARGLPVCVVPLLDIICQEAEDYFNGNKRADEVISVIENRVSLYLNERHQKSLP